MIWGSNLYVVNRFGPYPLTVSTYARKRTSTRVPSWKARKSSLSLSRLRTLCTNASICCRATSASIFPHAMCTYINKALTKWSILSTPAMYYLPNSPFSTTFISWSSRTIIKPVVSPNHLRTLLPVDERQEECNSNKRETHRL
jgi:hypothetical protein